MKICFLVAKDILRGGGIEKYTREVGRRLVARGHVVQVYSTRGADSGPAEWEGMHILWLPRMQPYWAEKIAGALSSTLLAMPPSPRPDLFHLHSVAAGGMAPLLRMRGTPCLLQMHGIEWQRSRWGMLARKALNALEKISFAGADEVTAVSRAQCRFYEERYGRPVHFIPTGTELRDSNSHPNFTHQGIMSGRYFFTAVRLVREKGVHYLIPAFRRIPGSHPAARWSLVIAGAAVDPAYHRELLDLAGGDPRIIFLGHVEEPHLGSLYSNAGVYVQASELEGMAISLLDAMGSARCCIVSDIVENVDVLGDAGFIFPSKSIDGLRRCMEESSATPEAIRRFGDDARRRVAENFSWDSVTLRLEELYKQTIEWQNLSRQIRKNSIKEISA